MSFIVTFVRVLAQVLNLTILVRVLMSWLPISPDSRFAMLIYEITEPVLGPIRRIVPNMGGLDISPMLAMILVQMIERILVTILARFMF